MWLSHHYPGDYHRCVRIGWRHVCRRCLWFYPACFAVTALSLVGVSWPAGADPVLLWLLPAPVVAEWWGEHLGRIRYSPRRQVLLSLLAAPAVGRGFARYLEAPGDRLFWSVVVAYAVICAAALVVGRSPGPGDAPELEGVAEQRVPWDDPDGDPSPAGAVEREFAPVAVVSVDGVSGGDHLHRCARLELTSLSDEA